MGFKIGTLSRDLHSLGGSALYKGDKVKYKIHRCVGDDSYRSYEFHYQALEIQMLIRSSEFLIEEEINTVNTIKYLNKLLDSKTFLQSERYLTYLKGLLKYDEYKELSSTKISRFDRDKICLDYLIKLYSLPE